MIEIVFIGTGGGRFAMVTQKRRTGGIRILSKDRKANIHIDPGPGALVYSIEMGLNPQKINALLVSHSHPDHSNDAEVLIEAMSRGTLKKRGLLAAAHSVLHGNEVCEQSISGYHQKMPETVIDARPGTRFKIYGIEARATKAVHSDPDAVGFRLETGFGDIAYMPDSEYFDGVEEDYSGARILILSVLRPSGLPWKGHMTTDDAARIIEETMPEVAVITHFGMRMIFKGPAREAKRIESKTGIPTTAATDGMRIVLGKEIRVGGLKGQMGLGRFIG